MSELFDAAFFAKLNQLKMTQHIRLDRGLSGGRKSTAKGSSVEFSDFREYLPGDDIRRIDWNVYGRLDKLYVRQFMEEKEAGYHIFVDTSASMDYGEQKKSHMALRLAAALSWVVLRQLDRVEVCGFADGRLDSFSPVTGRAKFDRLLKELEGVTFGGQTGLAEAVRRGRFRGRGISIVISDFFDPAGLSGALRYLAYRRQEILLIRVLSREEIDFEGEGTAALTDMETGEELRVTLTRRTIGAYQDALRQDQKKLGELARAYQADLLTVIADEPLEKVFFETMRTVFAE